jgi:hypothetical protein
VGLGADAAEGFVRGEAVAAGRDGAELDLLLQAGDADLEELVEVAAETMQRKRRRSSSGTRSSAAWPRTRRLKASRDSSRLRKCSGGKRLALDALFIISIGSGIANMFKRQFMTVM